MIGLLALLVMAAAINAFAQPVPPLSEELQPGADALQAPSAKNLLKTPVSRLVPGGAQEHREISNPAGQSPEAVQRGMKYFISLNCVGCHAPNGGGGMGPALSNRYFMYGSEPANIYLSIYQGRPNGMPAWGMVLPGGVIWDLVSYVRSISREPAPSWGKTFSAEALTIEQVPTEFMQTVSPWDYIEKFSQGQKPAGTH